MVLHGHLPWVHMPEYPEFLEEDWLFEAVVGTYLPLLAMFARLEAEGIPSPCVVGLTPPLLEMLRAEALQKKLGAHLDARLRLAGLEARRLKGRGPEALAARHYLERAEESRALWHSASGDLVTLFARHVRSGRIAAMASAATHAVLPLVATAAARRRQVALGCRLFEEVFAEPARGFWLPECAYEPGIDQILAEHGLEWTVLETHAITDAWPPVPHDHRRPIQLPAGVVAFARDPKASRQVWAHEVGYPGDPEYRELYRDLGHDGAYGYVRRFLKRDGVRRNLGFKYHRVTGKVPLHLKELWNLDAARARTAEHARHFLAQRREDAAGLDHAVLTAPYDMELFGHWWYEGPWFLEELFRQSAANVEGVPFALPSEVLHPSRPLAVADPPLCTWGEDGYLKVWLNDTNAWVLRQQNELELRVEHALNAAHAETPPEITNQLVRELLLLQSSDWAFILTKATSDHFARQRVCTHISRILGLVEGLGTPGLERSDWFKSLAAEDSLFPGLCANNACALPPSGVSLGTAAAATPPDAPLPTSASL
jgi:1,4-alpha-glucan branching enzyme